MALHSIRPDWPACDCEIIRGHQVALGDSSDKRFPEGTLWMQLPHFRSAGLDLTGWYLATMNLSLRPLSYEVIKPRLTFRQVKWHHKVPAEDFSFMDCRIKNRQSLIYYPHPETKPEHEQPIDVLEVFLPERLPNIAYGSVIRFSPNPKQIRLISY